MDRGKVIIVGAGPGSRDLISLRGARALRAADVIFYDNLVSPALLALARRETRKVCVGKEPGGRGWKQEEINYGLLEAAAEGEASCVGAKT